MPLLKCPKQEILLEYVSSPMGLGIWDRMTIRWHSLRCQTCHEKVSLIKSKWDSYFLVEPDDITSSLIRVYSRLQNDETLILKGWKLNNLRSPRGFTSLLLGGGWLFRGAVALGVGCLITFLFTAQVSSGKRSQELLPGMKVPYAQIRFEDKNRIQVRYVRPELLQSIEFETAGMR